MVLDTIDGRRAAWQDARQVFEGIPLQYRYAVIDAPHGLLLGQVWTQESMWDRRLEATDAMIRSLSAVPGTPAAPWADEPTSDVVEVSLLDARADAGLSFGVWRSGISAAPPEGSPFRTRTYTAGARELMGFLTADPGDGARHPAVLWVEGGFGGPTSPWERGPAANDQSAMDFVDAGFVVFAPALRGELTNPGGMELFYGETEDLLAALAHLRAVPYVDPERIYLAGHSTGGTNVLLAAVAGAEARATLVFGGRASMEGALQHYPDLPFDREDPVQVRLRSAVHWAGHLTHPVYYFEGDQSYLTDAAVMGRRAAEAGKQMFVHPVPGADHFTALAPVRSVIIPKMWKDRPGDPPFEVTEAELLEAMLAAGG